MIAMLAVSVTEARAPYWPIVTCLLGVLCGVLLHCCYIAWEDRSR